MDSQVEKSRLIDRIRSRYPYPREWLNGRSIAQLKAMACRKIKPKKESNPKEPKRAVAFIPKKAEWPVYEEDDGEQYVNSDSGLKEIFYP